MLPIVTPAEMAVIDANATEPLEVLIDRAGSAVARAALRMLGGGYGRRVAVIAGKGNNGADGSVAAERLRRRGVRVEVHDATDPGTLGRADLVIDAAYGTGLGREFHAPAVGDVPVLAVDIPSGINGLTGEVMGSPLRAERTVCLAALKPGNLFEPGASFGGVVDVVDLGSALDVSGAKAHLLEVSDLRDLLPRRAATAHKWKSACWVVGGSATMTGAPLLAAGGAARSGAGYVRLSIPGCPAAPAGTLAEAVFDALDPAGWADTVVGSLERIAALVIGPGLGRAPDTIDAVRSVVGRAHTPLVVDADALFALGQNHGPLVDRRDLATVLTPHDGEFEVLTGSRPGADRIAAARSLAAETDAVVLLKGPTTVVASPDGQVRLSRAGDARLATAGTGDVLAGIIGSLLAQGLSAFDAASAGAELHGQASRHGPLRGFIASDILTHLPQAAARLATP